MTTRISSALHLCLILTAIISLSLAAQQQETPSIADFTAEMEKTEGFYSFYWDATTASLYLEIDRWNEECIYYTSLPRGMGSNDVGLDRAKLGSNRIIHFERHGNTVMMVEPNYSYRANTDNDEEREAVAESFAKSIIAALPVVAADGDTVVVKTNGLLMQDVNNVAASLQWTGQGRYALDPNRSTIYKENTKAFPDNTEIEVISTFAGQPEGRYVRSVTPSADSVTLHQRHSFVRLPEPGYTPRAHHPESGYIPLAYVDMATPFDESKVKRYIHRHRLEKKDPTAEVSEPVEPIVYYVDSGVPEPVKSALLDGARWWKEAFEAAGFKGGYVVKELPADADPMDARYNVINWVHRSTRGWSYGSSIYDPRTGEIIKGHVSLGSLRIRQDYLIACGLTSPYGNDEKLKAAREMALARIRQLSAHEVGHTIGILHNYTASTDDDASVMDYPHPFITLDESGEVDLSDAYDVGIGEWDIQAIKYGYSQFAPGSEESAELAAVLAETRSKGLSYMTDAEARPQGSAHPRAHLWDNGTDAAARLAEVMAVRAKALETFSVNAIAPGTPMSELEKALVPMYLFHRYQVEAAVKLIGGYEYNYAVNGETDVIMEPVSEDLQRRALVELLDTLDPATLTISDRIAEMIPPPAPAYSRDRESFPGNAFILDRVEIARSAAAFSLDLLLHPHRLNRLAMTESGLTLEIMLNELIAETWREAVASGLTGQVDRAIRLEVINAMIRAYQSSDTSDPARALVMSSLLRLKAAELEGSFADPGDAYRLLAQKRLDAFMASPDEFKAEPAPSLPPGSPIG